MALRLNHASPLSRTIGRYFDLVKWVREVLPSTPWLTTSECRENALFGGTSPPSKDADEPCFLAVSGDMRLTIVERGVNDD